MGVQNRTCALTSQLRQRLVRMYLDCCPRSVPLPPFPQPSMPPPGAPKPKAPPPPSFHTLASKASALAPGDDKLVSAAADREELDRDAARKVGVRSSNQPSLLLTALLPLSL